MPDDLKSCLETLVGFYVQHWPAAASAKFTTEAHYGAVLPLSAAERTALARHAGKIKACFYNAQRAATDDADLRYVEGWVISPDCPIPLDHAWIEDTQGRVIELTMRPVHTHGGKATIEPAIGALYYGVAIPAALISRVWLKDGLARPLIGDYLNG